MERSFCILLIFIHSIECQGTDTTSTTSSLRLTKSKFQLIRQTYFEGRDLFDLAIHAGIYEKHGNENLPGAERGAISIQGRTWHGSNGVGLVSYDPWLKMYSIYYLQEEAVPGHHLNIVFADEEFIFFSYGYHKDLPTVQASLEVYSLKRNTFARIDSVNTCGGQFGYFDYELLKAKRPNNIGPAMGWDHRKYSDKEWIPLTESKLFSPDCVTLQDDLYTLWYHTNWDIEEFVTSIQFKKSDLEDEIKRIAQKLNEKEQ